MKNFRRIAMALCCTLFLATGTSFAQQAPPPHAPAIHGALLSGEELVADLKFLTELAPNGANGWKLLKQVLDTFMDGTDPSKPVIVDVILNSTGSEVRTYFPVKDPPGKPLGQKFLANLEGFGIKSKRLAAGLFQLGGGDKIDPQAVFNGFLRVLSTPINYAVIASSRNNLPANLTDPTKGKTVAALLAKKLDLGLMIRNEKQSTADQEARKKDFLKVKDNLTAGLKQQADESAETFELRKGTLTHNLDELERFIAESAELVFGWTTDSGKREARLDFELSTIAGTALETSAKLLGQTPGMFASVPRSADAMLSGRINFPLDEMRKTHAIGAIVLARASASKRIDTEKDKTDEWKDSTKAASNLWFDIMQTGVNAGVVEGMIEVSQAPGEKINLVFGIKAPNGNDLKPILELLPKMKSDVKVQFDIEKAGEVSIHSITIPVADADIEEAFGKDAVLYVATGPTAWWVAIGSKSLEQLKAAIEVVGKANDADASNFLTLFVKASPWIELLDGRSTRRDGADPAKKDPAKKLTDEEAAAAKAKRDREAVRKLALEAFKAGKDTWETKLEAKDGKVTGSTRFDEGILRFIGSGIAKFSNENLK
ncbi:MAG: hypothetical protein NT013_11835 [Planctomycetia bacterium]|nr:hypothetical protein [Planctomycetia bacterium]